jgi:hypothetical protein
LPVRLPEQLEAGRARVVPVRPVLVAPAVRVAPMATHRAAPVVRPLVAGAAVAAVVQGLEC